MSNKKETPVRWLIDEYHTSGDLTWTDFDHALQMEAVKQQKYDEMLGMLEGRFEYLDSLGLNINSREFKDYCKLKQLIKEAKEL